MENLGEILQKLRRNFKINFKKNFTEIRKKF